LLVSKNNIKLGADQETQISAIATAPQIVLELWIFLTLKFFAIDDRSLALSGLISKGILRI
jgi:hypothetical protein